MPGVAALGLTGAQVRQSGPIGDAPQQQVAAGVFLVHINQGHGAVAAGGNGDGVLLRGDVEQVLM